MIGQASAVNTSPSSNGSSGDSEVMSQLCHDILSKLPAPFCVDAALRLGSFRTDYFIVIIFVSLLLLLANASIDKQN